MKAPDVGKIQQASDMTCIVAYDIVQMRLSNEHARDTDLPGTGKYSRANATTRTNHLSMPGPKRATKFTPAVISHFH
jgi:hypothetical protein